MSPRIDDPKYTQRPSVTICIQCALEALVAGVPDTELPRAAWFEESPEIHRARLHPDLKETQIRRQWLEAEASKLITGKLVRPCCPKCGHDVGTVENASPLQGVALVQCAQCGHRYNAQFKV